jgi:spastin
MNPNYNNNNYNYNNYNQNYNNNNYPRQGVPNQNQNFNQQQNNNYSQNQNYPQNQKINYPQNQSQNPNFQQNPNQNPNMNFQQNPNQQRNQNNQGVNQYQEKLRIAYNMFSSGVKDYKSFSLEMALDKFEKVSKIIKEAYPHIQNNPALKETTDKFARQVKQYLTSTEYQIEHRFDYKSTAGYADVDSKKKQREEIAQMIRDAESSNKKTTYYVPQNNNVNNSSNQQNFNNSTNVNNTNTNSNSNKNASSNAKKDDKSIVTNDLREKILSEIVESKPDVKFDDVVGLKEAKQILKEIIIIPNLRPDLFTGLRAPPRGLLLFGPPGTGKTMIAKAVATECKCTFFSISASSLTSKYLGESEKLVRALFQLAYEMQPSVVFIDEIESILSKRKEGENDAMKRLKTEFLIQFDGVGSSEENRVLIIGATNRPFDLDPAVIRRLPKRVYVGPFNDEEKKGFIKKIISQNKCNITDEQFLQIAKMCNNYSNSDLKELCREAAYEPLRELNASKLQKVNELRAITFEDFNKAIRKVRGTLTKDILRELEKWNEDFGALGGS